MKKVISFIALPLALMILLSACLGQPTGTTGSTEGSASGQTEPGTNKTEPTAGETTGSTEPDATEDKTLSPAELTTAEDFEKFIRDNEWYWRVLGCIFEKPHVHADALGYIDSLPPRADIRLAAMLCGDENADAHVASLKPSARFFDRVHAILHCELPTDTDLPALRRLVHASGKAAALDRALLEKNTVLFVKLTALLETETCFAVSDLAITGADVLEVTELRGKAVGEALQDLLFKVFDGKVSNTREDLLDSLLKS